MEYHLLQASKEVKAMAIERDTHVSCFYLSEGLHRKAVGGRTNSSKVLVAAACPEIYKKPIECLHPTTYSSIYLLKKSFGMLERYVDQHSFLCICLLQWCPAIFQLPTSHLYDWQASQVGKQYMTMPERCKSLCF